MPPRTLLTAALLALLFAAPAHAQSVSVERGNVVYTSADGAARTLTRGGRDAFPALSPDGRTVAFVRGTGRRVQGPAYEQDETDLWIVDVATGREIRLLGPLLSDEPAKALVGMHALAFSPDGGTLYFTAGGWVTSGAIHALDLRTRSTHYLFPGNELIVIHHGRYRGHLLVNQHRYNDNGSYDHFWLYTPDGRKVKQVGEDAEPFLRREGAIPD